MLNPSQSQIVQRQAYQAMQELGSPQIASNSRLVLDGFENISILIQTFTHPIATDTEATEVALAGGFKTYTDGVPKCNFTSPITLVETKSGAIAAFSQALQTWPKSIDGWSYYGNKDNYTKRFRWRGCKLNFDNGIEAAADGNGQVSTVSGTISYNYFGEADAIGG